MLTLSFISFTFVNLNSSNMKGCFFSHIYLVIQFFISVWTKGFFFFLWVKTSTIIINFVTQIVPALAIGSSFKLAPVSFRHVKFLALQDILCSFGIFLVPAMESTISPRNPYSFYGRMVLRNQDLGTRYSHCYCGVISPRPSERSLEFSPTEWELWANKMVVVLIYDVLQYFVMQE